MSLPQTHSRIIDKWKIQIRNVNITFISRTWHIDNVITCEHVVTRCIQHRYILWQVTLVTHTLLDKFTFPPSENPFPIIWSCPRCGRWYSASVRWPWCGRYAACLCTPTHQLSIHAVVVMRYHVYVERPGTKIPLLYQLMFSCWDHMRPAWESLYIPHLSSIDLSTFIGVWF